MYWYMIYYSGTWLFVKLEHFLMPAMPPSFLEAVEQPGFPDNHSALALLWVLTLAHTGRWQMWKQPLMVAWSTLLRQECTWFKRGVDSKLISFTDLYAVQSADSCIWIYIYIWLCDYVHIYTADCSAGTGQEQKRIMDYTSTYLQYSYMHSVGETHPEYDGLERSSFILASWSISTGFVSCSILANMEWRSPDFHLADIPWNCANTPCKGILNLLAAHVYGFNF